MISLRLNGFSDVAPGERRDRRERERERERDRRERERESTVKRGCRERVKRGRKNTKKTRVRLTQISVGFGISIE